MLAAKEKTEPLGASLAQAETRVWGLPSGNENGIGGCWPVTSTHVWGCWHIYGGTASDGLVNRYYSNAYGRFMTPDPYQASGGPADPQSWNRYAYTAGDPVNRLDATGLDYELVCGGSEDSPSGGSCGVMDINQGECFTIYSSGFFGGGYMNPACGFGSGLPAGITAGGSSGSHSYSDALRAARTAQSSESKLKDSGPCDKVLAALGMSWQGLQSAVASESFQDGTQSTELMSNLFTLSSNYQSAVAQYGNQTVQNYLANKGSNAAAVASAGGNLVFLNYNQFGGGLNVDNEATLMHEALHNATGMTDMQLQSALQSFGLKVGASSNNITNLMSKDCVF